LKLEQGLVFYLVLLSQSQLENVLYASSYPLKRQTPYNLSTFSKKANEKVKK
jgi:hypothetical protein